MLPVVQVSLSASLKVVCFMHMWAAHTRNPRALVRSQCRKYGGRNIQSFIFDTSAQEHNTHPSDRRALILEHGGNCLSGKVNQQSIGCTGIHTCMWYSSSGDRRDDAEVLLAERKVQMPRCRPELWCMQKPFQHGSHRPKVS
jgi:hypothetical protein